MLAGPTVRGRYWVISQVLCHRRHRAQMKRTGWCLRPTKPRGRRRSRHEQGRSDTEVIESYGYGDYLSGPPRFGPRSTKIICGGVQHIPSRWGHSPSNPVSVQERYQNRRRCGDGGKRVRSLGHPRNPWMTTQAGGVRALDSLHEVGGSVQDNSETGITYRYLPHKWKLRCFRRILAGDRDSGGIDTPSRGRPRYPAPTSIPWGCTAPPWVPDANKIGLNRLLGSALTCRRGVPALVRRKGAQATLRA